MPNVPRFPGHGANGILKPSSSSVMVLLRSSKDRKYHFPSWRKCPSMISGKGQLVAAIFHRRQNEVSSGSAETDRMAEYGISKSPVTAARRVIPVRCTTSRSSSNSMVRAISFHLRNVVAARTRRPRRLPERAQRQSPADSRTLTALPNRSLNVDRSLAQPFDTPQCRECSHAQQKADAAEDLPDNPGLTQSERGDAGRERCQSAGDNREQDDAHPEPSLAFPGQVAAHSTRYADERASEAAHQAPVDAGKQVRIKPGISHCQSSFGESYPPAPFGLKS